jgi:hypothetical protein
MLSANSPGLVIFPKKEVSQSRRVSNISGEARLRKNACEFLFGVYKDIVDCEFQGNMTIKGNFQQGSSVNPGFPTKFHSDPIVTQVT